MNIPQGEAYAPRFSSKAHLSTFLAMENDYSKIIHLIREDFFTQTIKSKNASPPLSYEQFLGGLKGKKAYPHLGSAHYNLVGTMTKTLLGLNHLSENELDAINIDRYVASQQVGGGELSSEQEIRHALSAFEEKGLITFENKGDNNRERVSTTALGELAINVLKTQKN